MSTALLPTGWLQPILSETTFTCTVTGMSIRPVLPICSYCYTKVHAKFTANISDALDFVAVGRVFVSWAFLSLEYFGKETQLDEKVLNFPEESDSVIQTAGHIQLLTSIKRQIRGAPRRGAARDKASLDPQMSVLGGTHTHPLQKKKQKKTKKGSSQRLKIPNFLPPVNARGLKPHLWNYSVWQPGGFELTEVQTPL